MTQTLERTAPPHPTTTAPTPPERTVDWRRMRSPAAAAALVCSALAAVSLTLGTVVVGRLAETPTTALVQLLAVLAGKQTKVAAAQAVAGAVPGVGGLAGLGGGAGGAGAVGARGRGLGGGGVEGHGRSPDG